MNLARVISDCIEQNRSAQFRLFDNYIDFASNVCKRYCYDVDNQKEAVQLTFIKVFKNLESFDSNKGSFEGWLKRIAINESLQLIRRNKRLKLVFEDIPEDQAIEYPEIDFEVHEQMIMGLVQKLPEGYKTVFLLYVVDEWSHQDIAIMLGITESTSRSQLYKARKLLASQLKKTSPIEKVG